jgi:O-antigen/teichoic acid export membrane protein
MTLRPQERSRFLPNIAALGVSTAVSTLFTFAQVKILALSLTLEMFGLFAALRGLSLLVSMIASNGLPQLLVRFLPVHEARGDARRAMILTVVCAACATGAVAVLVVVVHALRSILLSGVPAAEITPRFEVWFYATTVAVTLKLVLYGGLNGLRRLGAQTWIESTSLLVQVVWIFAARDRLDLETLFFITGAVSLSTMAVGAPWYLIRLRRDTATGGAAPASGGETPSYRAYWVGAAGLSVVAMAFTDVDRYVLSSVLALELLSLFHIGSRVVRLAGRLMSIPVLAFQPEVSRLDAEGRGGDVELSTRVFLKFNIVTSLFITTGLIVFSSEIIELIANASYLSARPLLIILAASLPFSAMTAPLTAVMKALDQVRRALYCDLAWAATYVVALLVLGHRFGLVGAGIAQGVASILQLSLAGALCRMRLPSLAVPALARGAAACAVAYAPVVAAAWLPGPYALRLSVRVALFAAGLWLFRRTLSMLRVLSADERERLARLLGRGGAGRLTRRLLS